MIILTGRSKLTRLFSVAEMCQGRETGIECVYQFKNNNLKFYFRLYCVLYYKSLSLYYKKYIMSEVCRKGKQSLKSRMKEMQRASAR